MFNKKIKELAIEKGFCKKNGSEVVFHKDRYTGAYSGDETTIFLVGWDRYGSDWAIQLADSDDITAATFWYNQKNKEPKFRCAFTRKEFWQYLNEEKVENQLGHALGWTVIFKEVKLSKQERLKFLDKNNYWGQHKESRDKFLESIKDEENTVNIEDTKDNASKNNSYSL